MAVPALIALAMKLLPLAGQVPEVIDALKGGNGVKAAEKLLGMASRVAGVEDPEVAVALVMKDPALGLQLQQLMSAERIEFARIAQQREQANLAADTEGARSATERAALLEGTAADLKAMPILGPIMLFARGAQRPLWGFACMYLDYMVFSGAWKLEEGVEQNCFFLINLLVLGFLFGERAVKNLAPLITDMLAKKAGVPAAARQ